ncbi:uncharacterized protein LOC120340489 [Styela clava]
MKYTFFAVFLLFNITNSSAQDPWKKKCVDGFELLFFKERKHYEAAKKSCEELEGYLAKVDNERITAAIKSLIDISETEMGFFIGGTDRANVEDWKWQDGTDVNMRGETGYQNWELNQPSSVIYKNDCVIVGGKTYQWTSTTCGRYYFYICQKKFQGSDVEIQTNVNQKKCSLTDCSTATQVEWYKASNKVSMATTSTVYQTIQNGLATLNFQNANISDAGSYSCRFLIGQTWKIETDTLEVPGKPTIHQILNNVCNSNLNILWQPHKNAVAFPHTIKVSPSKNGSTIWVDSPKDGKQLFTLTGLSPTTTYQIKITACVTKKNCSSKYPIIRSATTEGASLTIKTSSITQYKKNQTCVIVWSFPNNVTIGKSEAMEISLISELATFRGSSNQPNKRLFNVTSSLLYSFEPEPNHIYSASLKIFYCAGASQPHTANGSCIGNSGAPATVSPLRLIGNDVNKDGTKEMFLPRPDETNGLVSCMLVLVVKNRSVVDDQVSLSDLKKGNESSECGGYIAMAIPVSSMNEKGLQIILGDKSTSSCDVYDTGKKSSVKRRKRSTHGGYIFVGQNKQLYKEDYKAYVVTSTPSVNQIYYKRSPEITLKWAKEVENDANAAEKKLFEFNIVSFLIGFLIPTIFLVICLVIICRMNKTIKTAEAKEHNYETIQERANPTASNNSAFRPQYSNELQEADGYLQPLPKAITQTQVESAYETYNV